MQYSFSTSGDGVLLFTLGGVGFIVGLRGEPQLF